MARLDLFEIGGGGGIEPATAVHLDHALRGVGACYVRDAALPRALLGRFEQVTAEFFRRPLGGKLRLAAQGEAKLGYRPPGSASYAAADGSAVSGRDACELFKVGRDPGRDEPAGWAAEAPAMRDVWRETYGALAATAVAVGDALAVAAGPADPGVRGWVAGQTSNLATNWYPGGQAGDAEPEEGGLRGAHTDFGPFTLLHHPPGTGGLEVDVDGSWVAVPPIDGALVLLLGDLMAHTTGGRWRAPRHRVVAPPGDGERLSVVFFVFPDPASPVARPDGGGATTAGRFVAERWDRIYA
ncbi:isopenicillin N synthase family oxygenase [Iamia sp. SCSIO 61187]|uniref:2OG-Fe(II) oxygenase family protein n=1 Tax=Iamia sp. SCSIO 61187 TaxID=2722752 RepID=UPI001C636822|nr:2OG-Fe(II) oxygenase family protein [Iamia sp. SCSIO 61187]QYG94035.1 isopenicillin N synthase family oxygenase [Iamia sp. SCSIO 61187]